MPKLVLATLFRERMEDAIMVLCALSHSLDFFAVVASGNCHPCGGEGDFFAVGKCGSAGIAKASSLPLHLVFFSYLALVLLPIYFKAVHRMVLLLCWALVTVFTIAGLGWAQLRPQGYLVLLIIVVLLSIYEQERNKLCGFLEQRKQAVSEKKKVKEKSKDIETKLNLALVHQILPPKVAEAIKSGQPVLPESFEEVTIFFSDVEGFTTICAQVTPIQVVHMLNDLYTVMDYCTSLFPLYKVETIGDAYMLVGGLPTRDPKHAQHIADFALLVRSAVQAVKSPIDGSPIRIRIGLHSGPVMAGVVGNLMPRYCLFGDTVNTASRMESNGTAGLIHCSAKTAQILLAAGRHQVTKRGDIEVKGKGIMTTYWLDAAMPHNEHSNGQAIARVETTVDNMLAHSPREGEDSFVEDTAYSRYRKLTGCSTPGPDNNPTSPLVAAPSSSKLNSKQKTVSFDATSVQSEGSAPNLAAVHAASSFAEGASWRGPVNSINGSGSGSIATRRMSPMYQQRNTARFTQRLQQLGDAPALSLEQELLQLSRGSKILVVEDSMAQRKMLTQRLNKADATWDVSSAVSGEDALQKLKAAKLMFDIVFVDENLSVNDGLFGHELVHVMRDSFKMHMCVIIACTSNVAKNRESLINSGVDFVWPKPPPKPEEIKEKIEYLLRVKWEGEAQRQRGGECKV